MRKITIKIVAQDHDGVRLGAEGSMMVSDKEYDDFLDDPSEMLYHYSEQKNDVINSICKDAFAKIGIVIDSQYDLKYVAERYYSEDGELCSMPVYGYPKEKYSEQDDLCYFLKIAENMFAQESNQDNQ